MTPLIVIVALMLGAAQDERQEQPRVPKDSIELTVVGCLKGRVLSTIEKRQTDVESGPYVGARRFRVAGKRPVMDEVKRQDGHLVEAVGIVKRSALDDTGMKAGPVTIVGGRPAAGRAGIPSGADNVPVMDLTSVRLRSTSCSAQ